MSDENSVTLSLTESEWMRRTPSPAKETLIEKLCIPEKRAKLKHRLLSPERMAEMMELSMTEDDETGQNDGDLKSWDKDRGLDGGAIELVALHRHYHQQSQQSDQSGAEGGDVGNTFDDYEVI